jgi:TRAP-type uncharacterized transport system substrate-binding protein
MARWAWYVGPGSDRRRAGATSRVEENNDRGISSGSSGGSDESTADAAPGRESAGARFLPLGPDQPEVLEAQGFRRGLIEKSRYPSLPHDVPTVGFSGWPIYCRSDTPDALAEKFCQALVSRRDDIVWDIGGVHQPPLPLERMAKESPATPLDVPLHPRAAAVWQQHGYLP